MAANILDGNAIAAEMREDIKREVKAMKVPPCLAVVLCSDDPASKIYIKKKQEACAEVGIQSQLHQVSDRSMYQLWSKIDELNDDDCVNGIIVQLPLPKDYSPYTAFDRIEPMKDVDVFNPTNVGLLVQGRPRFKPCTPAGIQELLTRSGIQISGKKVCIINRSDIVGKPLHSLLIQNFDDANATIAHCHDHTPPERLKSLCLQAEIIVVAVGIPGFLTADMVSPQVVVVDVGINRVSEKKIVGDVDFEAVSEKAAWISKVPGGVGPMTVTCLLRNTLEAKKLQDQLLK